MTSNQSQGVITSGLVNVTSAANSTCTQTCQTGLTTFPDDNYITSSFTVQFSLPRQQADLIEFSRLWLAQNRCWLTGCRFQRSGCGRRLFMHTSVYQKVVAFDFMFPPLPLLVENPKTYCWQKGNLTKNIGLTFGTNSLEDSQFSCFENSLTWGYRRHHSRPHFSPPLFCVFLVANTTWPTNERNFDYCWLLRVVDYFKSTHLQGKTFIRKKNQDRENKTSRTIAHRREYAGFFTIRCTNYIPWQPRPRVGHVRLTSWNTILWMWSFIVDLSRWITRYFGLSLFSVKIIKCASTGLGEITDILPFQVCHVSHLATRAKLYYTRKKNTVVNSLAMIVLLMVISRYLSNYTLRLPSKWLGKKSKFSLCHAWRGRCFNVVPANLWGSLSLFWFKILNGFCRIRECLCQVLTWIIFTLPRNGVGSGDQGIETIEIITKQRWNWWRWTISDCRLGSIERWWYDCGWKNSQTEQRGKVSDPLYLLKQ